MTNPMQNVKDVLGAIKSVRIRAKKAAEDGDLLAYRELMGDLLTLEVVLVDEAETLVDSMEKKAA